LEFNVPFQQKYGYIRDELTTGNICTKNYWNPTAIVEIIIGGWVVSFFETQCISFCLAYVSQGYFSAPVLCFVRLCRTKIHISTFSSWDLNVEKFSDST